MRHCFIVLTENMGENIMEKIFGRGQCRNMERASGILRRIMLAILMVILALALALTCLRGFQSPSYLAALALGLFAALAFLLLKSRSRLYRRFEAFCLRQGKVRCGAAVVLLCFVTGLAWILLIPIEPFSDYKTYWDCAVSLAYGREIFSNEYVAMYPHILGYSSFLAPFIRIFGPHVQLGTLLGLLLSCLSALLIFALCLEVAGLFPAVLAGLLWGFYPGRVMLGSLIFSEPLYTCLVLLFLWLMLRLQKRQRKAGLPQAAAWGLGLGLLLAAINAVRPISAILLIALLLWLLLLRGREAKEGRLWRFWLVCLAALLLCFQCSGKLWSRHLEQVLGEEPAGLPVYNLYVGFNMDTLGQWSSEDMDLLFAYRRQEGGSAPLAQKQMLPHVLERLQSDELDLPRLFAAKLFVFLGNDELGGYTYRFTRSEGFVKICMVICNCFYYLVLPLALLGLARLRKGNQPSAFLLLPLYTLGLTLAHMLIEVSSRYHYSLIPMFIILAALNGQTKPENKGESL